MFTLNAENRNTALKPKQLRRECKIPGVLYGKNLGESISIQISKKEAERFLKTNAVGSKVEVDVGGSKHTSLFREASYKPATAELEHLSFQTLLANEVVSSTARIILLNKEKVPGMVQHTLTEFAYKALPAHMIDKIEIDLEGKQIGDSLRLGDLEIANDSNVEILTPLDMMVYSVVDARKPLEVPESDDTEGEAAESAVAAE